MQIAFVSKFGSQAFRTARLEKSALNHPWEVLYFRTQTRSLKSVHEPPLSLFFHRPPTPHYPPLSQLSISFSFSYLSGYKAWTSALIWLTRTKRNRLQSNCPTAIPWALLFLPQVRWGSTVCSSCLFYPDWSWVSCLQGNQKLAGPTVRQL